MDRSLFETIVSRIFALLETEHPIFVFNEEERILMVNIGSQDSRALIGEQGRSLDDMQYLLRVLARKNIGEQVSVVLDINGYKKAREEHVKELARSAADEVVLFRAPKELPPMNSAERRAVHVELAKREDVKTESVGEGLDRRVVVRLIKEISPAES